MQFNKQVLDLYNRQFEKIQIIQNMDETEYHALTALSSGQIKSLLNSPKQWLHDVFVEPEKDSPTLRLGKYFHMAILEPKKFADNVYVLPDGDGRSKEVKEAKANAPAGAVILSRDEYENILGMRKSLFDHPKAHVICGLPKEQTEVTILFNANGYAAKTRIDAYQVYVENSRKKAIIYDLKTTENITQWGFSKSIADYGYHIQAAWYCLGLSYALGIDMVDVDYKIIACKKKGDMDCVIGKLNDASIEVGFEKIKIALEKFNTFMQNPVLENAVYAKDELDFSLPAYAFYDHKE